MNTKNLKWDDYWWKPTFKNKKYSSYFDGYQYPFVELDKKIIIWRPAKILTLRK